MGASEEESGFENAAIIFFAGLLSPRAAGVICLPFKHTLSLVEIVLPHLTTHDLHACSHFLQIAALPNAIQHGGISENASSSSLFVLKTNDHQSTARLLLKTKRAYGFLLYAVEERNG
ncbi:hypothetical protein OUZ56_031113 [Daphnia magna]|uniref:Uncharacterized protein n=1 Tax=Daphnia magna TaxID=35525 RepID=A0ABQ9ZTA6_9CRUS|nr:hypothetical protein OUZ56_031113 [Daphnia magna]